MAYNNYLLTSTSTGNQPHYNLLYLIKSKYENDLHSTAHFHSFTELYFILKGEGCFIIDNQKCEVREGNVIIINPNLMHSAYANKNNPIEFVILGIENLVFSSLEIAAKNNENNFFPCFDFYNHKRTLINFIDSINKELEEKKEYYFIACQNILNMLLVFIMRQTQLKGTEAPSVKMNKECAFVKHYMDFHFSENISLDCLAKKTCISKFHLAHSFKQVIGYSPIQYLNIKRIEQAQNFLLTTNYSITEISKLTGFSSPSYFSQIFKTHANVSPIKYRENAIKKK